MANVKFFIMVTFAAIVVVPCLAQEAGLTETNDKTTSKPTEYSDAEYRISSSLTDETIIEADKTPLSQLFRELSGMHNIRITIDDQAFRDLGLSPDQPITLTAKNISLGAAMTRLAEKLDLAYVVHEDALRFTSKKVALEKQSIKVFPLPKSLNGQGERIVTEVTKSVQPGLWKANGGNCEIMVTANELRVVGHERVFQEVRAFLDGLADQAESKARTAPK